MLSFFALGVSAKNAPADQQKPNHALALGDMEPQRKVYGQALKALNKGNRKQFKRLKTMLALYPLYPDLEYRDIAKRIHTLPKNEVHHFLQAQGNNQLGQRMRYIWLKALAKRGHWRSFLRDFDATTMTSDRMRCQWVSAHAKTGQALPSKQIAELWNVSYSQSKHCDPAFKAWKNNGGINDDIAWQRLHKTMQAGKLPLSKYLSKQLSPKLKTLAALYREAHHYPARLKNMSKFSTRDASLQSKLNQVVLHGFRRYAYKDAKSAYKLWLRYDSKNLFEEKQRQQTLYILARKLYQNGHRSEAQQLLAQYKVIDNTRLMESLIRESLAIQNWQMVRYWIDKLPSKARQSERWQYWLARSIEQSGQQPTPGLQADAIYRKLASERSFYGFLSADHVNQEYQLQHNPLAVEKDQKTRLLDNPALRRAHEYFRLGDNLNANREWFYLAKNLQQEELKALAALTHEWQWHIKTIQGMAHLKHWDDLDMRFPLAYSDELNKAAKATQVNQTLLYAIARQESAFAADARSPAGAMGLMQLMPATAKQTAKKIGVNYRYKDLYKPSSNIRLGSSYLNQLLQRFNGNRALAAAAYNAGPNRVDRWLKKASANLDLDSWIETIPYRETRGYVQNVLSYSVIYAHRMGDKGRLLQKGERQIN